MEMNKKNCRILYKIVNSEVPLYVKGSSYNASKNQNIPFTFSMEDLNWLFSKKLIKRNEVKSESDGEGGFYEYYFSVIARPEGEALIESLQKEKKETFWYKTYPTLISTLALLLSLFAFAFARGCIR
jgi:hypothetical protein